jgi:hypothetical protein
MYVEESLAVGNSTFAADVWRRRKVSTSLHQASLGGPKRVDSLPSLLVAGVPALPIIVPYSPIRADLLHPARYGRSASVNLASMMRKNPGVSGAELYKAQRRMSRKSEFIIIIFFAMVISLTMLFILGAVQRALTMLACERFW